MCNKIHIITCSLSGSLNPSSPVEKVLLKGTYLRSMLLRGHHRKVSHFRDSGRGAVSSLVIIIIMSYRISFVFNNAALLLILSSTHISALSYLAGRLQDRVACFVWYLPHSARRVSSAAASARAVWHWLWLLILAYRKNWRKAEFTS